MISINLLPEEFRIHVKKTTQIPALKIAIAVGALFAFATVYFYMDYVAAKGQLRKIEAEWGQIQPQSQELRQLEQKVETVLLPERDFLSRFVTTEKPLTNFLQWLSEYLPKTAWLVEVQMDRHAKGENLFVKGLAVPSKDKSSIEHIEDYLNQLKAKMPDARLSLTTTRQNVDKLEVTQFIANFQWGEPK